DPQRLCAPPVMDPLFGYQAVNVEAQERSPASLLNWTRRMIAMRQAHPTFGRGSIEFVETGNRRVLAFVRQHEDDVVLVVANLSGHVQTAQVQTSLEGVPVEMLGCTRFPPLTRGQVSLTLAPYGWYWLHVVDKNDPRATGESTSDFRKHALPDLLVSERWDTLFDGPGRAILERRYIRPYLERQSWYRAPGAVVRSVRIASHALARGGADPIVLAAVDVEGELETYRYGLVLTFTSGPRGEELLDRHPDRVLARIAGARTGVLHEVLEIDAARVLMKMLTDGASLTGRDGVFDAASQGRVVLADYEPFTLVPTTLGQTVVQCGAAAEMKVRRRLLSGKSHEHQVLAALAHNLDVELPVAYASIDLRTTDGQRWPFVLLRSQVTATEDGWQRALQLAQRWFAEPVALPDTSDPFVWLREGREAPRLDSEPLQEVERMARALGRRVATTHVAIADAGQSDGTDEAELARHRDRDHELADAALAALVDLDASARSRWTTLMDSPASSRVFGSRLVLGALARWRWTDGTPAPVDPDDSTPGVVGARGDYGERDIGALAADLTYVAVTALQQAQGREQLDAAARAWWSVATWGLVRGWRDELAASGRETIAMPDVIEGLRVSLIWRLLVDAVAAGEARRQMARAVLTDLAARPVGDRS
ncbi:MAG TPA: alpha-glucosidase C-terminal domain-containing protein, partial [Luteitalea sp.]|nr:alpha-glucosidase C-terminal domain-containing protein [Luteitalea sp.]